MASDASVSEEKIEILVDTLRQCFLADKARYHIAGYRNELFIEIEGLDKLHPDEITEVAEPVLEELELNFDEISLLPLKS